MTSLKTAAKETTSPRAPFNQVVMAMLKPSQSHSGGVIVDPYIENIAQELQFLTGEKKKPTPF